MQKVYNQVKTSWICLKMAEIAFRKTWNFNNFSGEVAPGPPTEAVHFVEPPLLKTWIPARIGHTFANFHTEVSLCSLKVVFRMLLIGRAIILAYSLKNQPGISSGPLLLAGLALSKYWRTLSSDTYGRNVGSSSNGMRSCISEHIEGVRTKFFGAEQKIVL